MKGIMIQGTQSDAGKSYIVTGISRMLSNMGYSVCPFKSQNMSNNSYVVASGKEIGRAQGAQAEAARQVPNVYMNPILLKPTTDQSSEVVLFGEVFKNYSGFGYRDGFALTKGVEAIKESLSYIDSNYDLIVIEGAGSPAEVNLNDREIVNMRVAELADVDVILVTNIDLGGSFASLVGTLELVGEHRSRIKGVIFNKFRGDIKLLDDGLKWFEEYTGVKVLGVIPYTEDIFIETEDAQSEIFAPVHRDIEIGVIHMSRVSNNTDVEPFIHEHDVSLRLITSVHDFGNPDAIIIPGTKSTIDDLSIIKHKGIANKIIEFSKTKPVMGICGGYQMLGRTITDELNVDSKSSRIDGLGLFDADTDFEETKRVENVTGKTLNGEFSVSGYEIHLGSTNSNEVPFAKLDNGTLDGAVKGDVTGTYLHNVFHNDEFRNSWLNNIRTNKNFNKKDVVWTTKIKEESFEKIGKLMEEHLDVDFLKELIL